MERMGNTQTKVGFLLKGKGRLALLLVPVLVMVSCGRAPARRQQTEVSPSSGILTEQLSARPSPPESSPLPQEQMEAFFRKGSSSYGRNLLNGVQQTAYDKILACVFAFSDTAEISLPDGDSLNRVITFLLRDYPGISWLSSRYRYEMNSKGQVISLRPEYTKEKSLALKEAAAIKAAAEQLTEGIDPSLSDFHKALILHDRLCQWVEYDPDAPNPQKLYGALGEGRATCEGYAKGYQFLLSLLGLEALIVYGEAAGSVHAWNIVRLDGDCYLADPTWGDAKLDSGETYLSHEYLFLDEESFSRSHTAYGEEHNYPLPSCSSMEQNYFLQRGTVLSEEGMDSLQKAIQTALDAAMADTSNAVQIRFATPALAALIDSRYIETGEADRFFQEKAAQRGKTALGRTYSVRSHVLTYLIENST